MANQDGALILSFNGLHGGEDEWTGPTAKNHLQSIVVEDLDAAPTDLFTVTLEAPRGNLTLLSRQSVTFTQGTGVLDSKVVFQGTLAQINEGLMSVNYSPQRDLTGWDTVSIMVHDGFDVVNSSITIWVDAVNDPPVIDVPKQLVVASGLDLTWPTEITDVDLEDTQAGVNGTLRVNLKAHSGVLSVNSLRGLKFVVNDGIDDPEVEFMGEIRDVNIALYALRYKCAVRDGCKPGQHFVTITVSDNGFSGGEKERGLFKDIAVTRTSTRRVDITVTET
jgi:hypothetical protein